MNRRFALTTAALIALATTAPAQFVGTRIPSGTNHCLRFDGVDDFVHVVRTTALEPAEVTVELWARLDGPQDWNSRLLRKGEHDAYFITADQDHDRRMQLLMTRGTQFRVQAKDTQQHTAYIGTWHHFLGIYATDHVEFWVDGEQRANVTHGLGALTHFPLTDLYIGAGLPVTLQNEYFAGAIDEVRIWNYPRTAAEIEATWNVSLAGNEPGLVAYWRFDEGEGRVAHDSTPFSHHGELGLSTGTVSGAPQWETSQVPIASASGTNYCLHFDGIDDFVHVVRTTALEPAEVTVELWARLDCEQDWNSRILRKCGHWADGYYLSTDADNDRRIQLMVSKSPPLLQVKDPQPHTDYIGEWHHFAGVYGQDFAELWVDGVMVKTVAHGFGAMSHMPLTDLYIGAGYPSTALNEFFAGSVDEVRIWNYPRTAAEIEATWNVSLAGDEPGLVAYWRFDEGEGLVAHDSTSFGHHGELGSSAGADSTAPAWEISLAPIGPAPCSFSLYCAGGINSTGQAATIGYQGSASIVTNDLELRVTRCVPDSFGFFYIGSHLAPIPWRDRDVCGIGNMMAMPDVVHLDGLGAGSRVFDFADPDSPASKIRAGSERSFLFWYRDPAPGAHEWNASDLLRVSFCP